MVWDPKDPWSRKSDPLEDALKQAQLQFKNLLPSGGFRNILLAGFLLFLAWQSAFIIGPDEEGIVSASAFRCGQWGLALISRSRSSSRCYSQKSRNFTAWKSAFGRIAKAGNR
jgi:hypothetical protein